MPYAPRAASSLVLGAASSALAALLAIGGCDRAAVEPRPPAAASHEATPARASAPPEVPSAPRVAASSAPPPSASAPVAAPRCVQRLASRPPPAPPPGPNPRCPRDPAGGPPVVPVGHVSFPGTDAPRLEVEVMRSEGEQARGLMYRKSLADDHGMLFTFPTPSVHTFWMHDTCLPLDMLFLDDAGFVAGIVENAPTLDDGPRSVDCPSLHVLEVNAGWARKHGVAPGQRFVIERAAPR